MDATTTERATLVSLSLGAQRALLLAAEQPERVVGAVFIAPAVALAPPHPERTVHPFDERLESTDGWAKYNRYYFSKCLTEPHSTKQIEDAVGWGLETTPATLAATTLAPELDEPTLRELCS
ncbi:MAG: alpha/beta fold hydrolase, partial [Thermoleophilaceae bacterium]